MFTTLYSDSSGLIPKAMMDFIVGFGICPRESTGYLLRKLNTMGGIHGSD
jgi:hypothetical protein